MNSQAALSFLLFKKDNPIVLENVEKDLVPPGDSIETLMTAKSQITFHSYLSIKILH